MSGIYTKTMLLDPTHIQNMSQLQDQRANAAIEKNRQFTDAINNAIGSLASYGQQLARYKMVDDEDEEFKNDPQWLAAKEEYARTGSSSAMNQFRSSWNAQKTSDALKEQTKKDNENKLSYYATELSRDDLDTSTRNRYMMEYNTIAQRLGKEPWNQSMSLNVQNIVEDIPQGTQIVEDAPRKSKIDISNDIKNATSELTDGTLTKEKLDAIKESIDGIENKKEKDELMDKFNSLNSSFAKAQDEARKAEEEKTKAELKALIQEMKTWKIGKSSWSGDDESILGFENILSKYAPGTEEYTEAKNMIENLKKGKVSYNPAKDLANLGDKKARDRLKEHGYSIGTEDGHWVAKKVAK